MKTREKEGSKRAAEVSEKMYSISFFAQYVTAFWQLFISTGAAIQTAGKLFPPIAYAFDGLRAFFNLFTRDESSETASVLPTPIPSKKGVYARRAANVTVVTLDVLVVLALAGVLLTNPIGWAIATVATFIGWMGDAVQPAWQARKEYLATGTEAAKTNYIKKRNEALWGFVAVVGMILFTCGPFGFATLGLIGSALFVAIAIRGIANGISTWRQNRKNRTPVSVQDADKVKFDHQNEEQHKLTIRQLSTARVQPETPISELDVGTGKKSSKDAFFDQKNPAHSDKSEKKPKVTPSPKSRGSE